jgi:hypothetical protein
VKSESGEVISRRLKAGLVLALGRNWGFSPPNGGSELFSANDSIYWERAVICHQYLILTSLKGGIEMMSRNVCTSV